MSMFDCSLPYIVKKENINEIIEIKNNSPFKIYINQKIKLHFPISNTYKTFYSLKIELPIVKKIIEKKFIFHKIKYQINLQIFEIPFKIISRNLYPIYDPQNLIENINNNIEINFKILPKSKFYVEKDKIFINKKDIEYINKLIIKEII